ncbi:diguanylate cyclase with GAF sensor [Clostridium cavendishii DSM 21758]|uniref:Diguanylate cyclase with GAF sensor n=1 Tax=Clostridium cavendishii DSM 21758 TaxID=1121302 RepID=A0A1M6Q4R4_9CLOT|nr:sensor domain-containing diguanylate cyclase [Clostridium cavendishii]SHK15151.1 diguanylate cyclase with GAF sensor [Clostridium cavendishii DSM 21758]
MGEYKIMYERLHEEFETYQSFAERQMQILNEKNIKLERNLDALTNIIEISKYVNSYISDDNLIAMINDMIVGVLGVNYSTIYLLEDGIFTVKATNSDNFNADLSIYNQEYIKSEEGFVINSTEAVFHEHTNKKDIHSVIGVPIKIRNEFIGYIIVEHTYFKFFNNEHIKFVASIANQIAIAIENSLLYKKVEESSKRDPFLKIYNRKYFFEAVERNIIDKSNSKFAIVMADIDNFKKLNDSHGHQFGDEALKQIVELFSSCLEEDDIIARYGGEEIILYLRNFKDEKDLFNRVDAIRNLIATTPICKNELCMNVTVSFGISFYPLDGHTIDEIIKVADINMYKAKNTGKNKVIISY